MLSLGIFTLFYDLLAKLLLNIYFVLICCPFAFSSVFLNFSNIIATNSIGFHISFYSSGLT